MKIAIVYNSENKGVINLFGIPNQEQIGRATIKRIADGLKAGGHKVKTVQGDKDLIDKLEMFMPRVISGETPGLVFNVSYGIQGQSRYTHVPGILEMVGVPYVGSGPMAHSLALDKVVAKMIFQQHGIPTPDYAMLEEPDFDLPDIAFPMVVKPKNEAVSFGLRVVRNEKELREGAGAILERFRQPVLVEKYIAGREINIGLLGNSPPETLPPVELVFGRKGPRVYTYEDKTRRSGREVGWKCPAPVNGRILKDAKALALKAFAAIGCADCARVDMRLDSKGNLYVLEVNSLPSLGRNGSYVVAAGVAGLNFGQLVCRLVEVASARYFGTPTPPQIEPPGRDTGRKIFSYLIERRDEMEKRILDSSQMSSRTSDPAGVHQLFHELDRFFREVGMSRLDALCSDRWVRTWQTQAGLDDGTLLVFHADVPLELDMAAPAFRRDPEWLYGEGIGTSRAPMVSIQFALRALRSQRLLRNLPVGVLCYADEGRHARFSADMITRAAARVGEVLVLRPGNMADRVVDQRRGWRRYRFTVSGASRRLGKVYKRRGVLRWATVCLDEFARLTSKADRVAVACADFRTEAFPQLLPHRITAVIDISFLDNAKANQVERQMQAVIAQPEYRATLDLVSERPPLRRTRKSGKLLKTLRQTANQWDIQLASESSLLPSVAGLVSPETAVVCGLGPVASNIDTPHEAVLRLSIMQRTLLLAQYLASRNKPTE